MADTKISALAELTTPAAADLVTILDVSDTSMAATGTNKYITYANLAAAIGGGTGDVVGPSSSVDSEVAVFSSTTGKLLKRATGSGIAKLTSGVLSAATAGTDYLTPSGSGASLTALNATQLTSGTVPTAQLGSGTASSSSYLRGDQTWTTIPGGGVTDHGALTGLADDDHPQYTLLAGRTGGQIHAGKSVFGGSSADRAAGFQVNARADVTIAGTTTANASSTITGVGTAFLSEVGINDRIALSSASSTFATVTDIASNTSLTVDDLLGNGTSQTILRRAAVARFDDRNGFPAFSISPAGSAALGNGTVPSTTPGCLTATRLITDSYRDSAENAFMTVSDSAPNRVLSIGNGGMWQINLTARTGVGELNATNLAGTWTAPAVDTFAFRFRPASGTQTADIVQYTSNDGATQYGAVSENGYFTTRKTSAPADAELAAGEAAYWLDSTNGAAKFMIKAKQANGTVVTGSVSLTP